MEHGLSRYGVGSRRGVVRPSGADWKLCGRPASGLEFIQNHRVAERALEEGRGLERQPVAGEAADDLHPQRQARRIKETRDVDAGCTQECPEPIEGRLFRSSSIHAAQRPRRRREQDVDAFHEVDECAPRLSGETARVIIGRGRDRRRLVEAARAVIGPSRSRWRSISSARAR